MIVFNGKLWRIWPYLSNFDLLKYIGLSPLLASPQEAPGSGVYPKSKTDPILEIPTIENHRIDVSHDFFTCFFKFCRYSGACGIGGAFVKVWGYPKRKTDPIFEIPTVENHRIDVSHDYLLVFSIFAITAAPAATAAPLGGSWGILK